MERTGYTRLYATVTGAALVVAGLLGLLESSEFQHPELGSDLLGFYAVNGWANLLHVVVGLVALLMARAWSLAYALLAAIFFLGLGLWGVFAADGTLLLDKLPAARAVNLVNLLLGLAAVACLLAVGWPGIKRLAATRVGRWRERRRLRRRRRERRRLERKRPATKRRSKPDKAKANQPESKPESKEPSKPGA